MATDLRHLRIIVAAADCGSFSSAALQLNTEISAVSRAVRDVEEALGVAVFERLPRGVRLTAAGAAYVESARDILARVSSAEQRARTAGGNGAGALCVGLVWPVTHRRNAELLGRFAADNPEVMLNVVEDSQDDVLARVRSGELHVGIVAAEPAPEPQLRPHPDLESAQLWLEALAVAVRQREPAEAFAWQDLAGSWLLCRPQDDWRRFVAYVEQLGGPTLQFMEQDVSGEGILALVGAGLGWAIVPGGLLGAEAVGSKLVPISSAGSALQAEAVWLRRTQNPALTRFLDLGRRLHGTGSNDAPSRSLDP